MSDRYDPWCVSTFATVSVGMGAAQSGPVKPGHYASDGDGFPWHHLPFRAQVGMSSTAILCAVETKVGMGRASKVIARKLHVGMGQVSEAYVTKDVSVGMGTIQVLHRLPATVAQGDQEGLLVPICRTQNSM